MPHHTLRLEDPEKICSFVADALRQSGVGATLLETLEPDLLGKLLGATNLTCTKLLFELDPTATMACATRATFSTHAAKLRETILREPPTFARR